MITFEAVTKRYPDGTVALDALDLTVPAGKTVVLVGPSGCGKTTSLRMINRLVEPTAGRILLDGTDIRGRNQAQLRRGIGYVIQQTGLFPHRTVADNIATVPVLTGLSRRKARDRALELITLVGLDPALAKRYPHQLSGGQQQRVGVARALAADPPVLLMDEPFSAVDPVVRASLQDQLLSLQAELHKTIVLVTHDIEEAIKVGDLVALFRPHGKLAQLAPPEELLAVPADDYVAGFVGFDRGIRRLSFVSTGRLPLGTGPVLTADATVAKARAAGEPWILVTEEGTGRARGWVDAARLAGQPDGGTLGKLAADGIGHSFTAGTDSLRAALDAAVLSPAGQAVAVDGEGRVLGVVTFDQLRAAIQAAGQADADADASRPRPARRARATPGRPAPMMWSWIPGNWSLIWQLTWENAKLGVLPALYGLVLSLPLGIIAARWRWFYPPVLTVINVLYAVPSLALFIALIPAFGLTDTTVIIALTVFSLCVILPNVVAGLRAVPAAVTQAATAMGYGPLRRLATIELPLATPVIIAGLRVGVVSGISLASVGQLIGVSSLGYLFVDGLQRSFPTEIYVGLVLVIALALVCDLLLVAAGRALTPWAARG